MARLDQIIEQLEEIVDRRLEENTCDLCHEILKVHKVEDGKYCFHCATELFG